STVHGLDQTGVTLAGSAQLLLAVATQRGIGVQLQLIFPFIKQVFSHIFHSTNTGANGFGSRFAVLKLAVQTVINALQLTTIKIHHAAELLKRILELFLAVLLCLLRRLDAVHQNIALVDTQLLHGAVVGTGTGTQQQRQTQYRQYSGIHLSVLPIRNASSVVAGAAGGK